MSANSELAPMDGAGPSGGIDNAPAIKKQRDDFGGLPENEEAAQRAMEAELARAPRCRDACQQCGTVHAVEGDPLCICIKCHKLSRIVWCGNCVECTFTRFCDLPGVNVADLERLPMFAQYIAWKKREMQQLAAINKMPWETS